MIGFTLFLDISVEHALLLQVVRHGVLGQKRRLEADFGSDPLAFGVGGAGRVIAAAAAAELRAKVGALNLVVLVNLAPGGIAYGAGNIDFEFQD